VLFPAEVLPIVSVLTNMVHFFLGLPILVAFLIVYRHYPRAESLLWFPVVVMVQLLFTTALALTLAPISHEALGSAAEVGLRAVAQP